MVVEQARFVIEVQYLDQDVVASETGRVDMENAYRLALRHKTPNAEIKLLCISSESCECAVMPETRLTPFPPPIQGRR